MIKNDIPPYNVALKSFIHFFECAIFFTRLYPPAVTLSTKIIVYGEVIFFLMPTTFSMLPHDKGWLVHLNFTSGRNLREPFVAWYKDKKVISKTPRTFRKVRRVTVRRFAHAAAYLQ